LGIYAMTGGATGIGNGIKSQLREQGHQVIVVDIKDADIIADLSTQQGRQQAIDGIRSAAPEGLDGFIPVAGVGPQVSPPSLVAKINYFGSVVVTEGVRDLVAKKRGGIVMICSNSARIMEYDAEYIDALAAGDEDAACARIDQLDGQTAYGGSKYAIGCWTRLHAPAFAAEGVNLNAVAPGFITTPLTDEGLNDKDFGETIQAFVDSVPIGRPGVPEDIANMVLFLLSEKASFVAGSIIYVDGGHDAVFRPSQY
jgi:NAD(P)-dependent dehydrogenase (short-subunit alcohol dehydrogenase family)